MSTQIAEHQHDEPLFPMPPLAEAPLRVAVRRLDLVAAARYEQEFRTAWEEAVQTDSTVPMHTFLHRWGVFVAVRRIPARAARFRELEREISEAPTKADARAAALEITAILDAAAAEVAA